MIGKPKYKINDVVSFTIIQDAKLQLKTGSIYIVDEYGTFSDDSDVSYDIMVQNDTHTAYVGYADGTMQYETRTGPCLYKHIREDHIVDDAMARILNKKANAGK